MHLPPSAPDDSSVGPSPGGRPFLDRPLRVVDFNNYFASTGGGPRTYLLRKYDYFSKLPDVAYHLLVPSEEDRTETLGNARMVSLRAHRVPGATDYRMFLSPRRLERLLREIRPDVVEVGAPYADPILVQLATRTLDTVVVGFWHADFPNISFDVYGSHLTPWLGQGLKRAGWWWARRTYGAFDATFAAADYAVD